MHYQVPPFMNDPDFSDFLNQIDFLPPPPPWQDSHFFNFPDQLPIAAGTSTQPSPPQLQVQDSDLFNFPDQFPNAAGASTQPSTQQFQFQDSADQFAIAARTSTQPPPQAICILLKMPAPFNTVNIQANDNEIVLKLKQWIQVTTKTLISRIVIKDPNGRELSDHMTLLQCQISDKSEVKVEFLLAPRKRSSSSQPPPPPTLPSEGKKMSVVLKYRDASMPVEVRAANKVSQLRTMLDAMNLEIPEPYFFIHKQDLIDENYSFTSQNVVQGDIFEIFPGRISSQMCFELKTSKPNSKAYFVTTCSDDTIQQLKEKIQRNEGISIDRILIRKNGIELPDHKTLHACSITSDSGITVDFLPDGKMHVVLKYGEGAMPVEVMAAHNVSQLRMELEKKLNLQLLVPYSFIHNQAVMDEESSFTMQNVVEGDVIELVPGRFGS